MAGLQGELSHDCSSGGAEKRPLRLTLVSSVGPLLTSLWIPGRSQALCKAGKCSELLGTGWHDCGPYSRLKAISEPFPVSAVPSAQLVCWRAWRPQRHTTPVLGGAYCSSDYLCCKDTQRWMASRNDRATSLCRLHTECFVFLTMAILPFWQRQAGFSRVAESNACFWIG